MAKQTSDSETRNVYKISDELKFLSMIYPVTSKLFSIKLLESRIKNMDSKTRLRAIRVINSLQTGKPYRL
jgi:hypothetical protein